MVVVDQKDSSSTVLCKAVITWILAKGGERSLLILSLFLGLEEVSESTFHQSDLEGLKSVATQEELQVLSLSWKLSTRQERLYALAEVAALL